MSYSLSVCVALCAARPWVTPFSWLYTCPCLDGVLDHEGVIKSAEIVILEWHSWSLASLWRNKVQLGLGIEQRVCRLTGKRRTKGAICGENTQLLPARPLQLIEKAAGKAQKDRYAKTPLSSPSMKGYAEVSSWSQRSFHHDEKLKISKRLGKERRSMKEQTDRAAEAIFATQCNSSPQTSLPVQISNIGKIGKRIHIEIPSTLFFNQNLLFPLPTAH